MAASGTAAAGLAADLGTLLEPAQQLAPPDIELRTSANGGGGVGAHRAVLAARCPGLAAADASAATMVLPEGVGLPAASRALEYVYTGAVRWPEGSGAGVGGGTSRSYVPPCASILSWVWQVPGHMQTY